MQQFAPALCSRTLRAAARLRAVPSRRCFGASAHGSSHADAHGDHGHGGASDAHGHGHGSPEAQKYERTQSYFLGEKHHTTESWEKFHVALLLGTAAWLFFASYAPNTNPHDWTRDEAEERMRRRAEGREVVYGVNYAALRAMKERGIITEETAAELEAGAVVKPGPVPMKRYIVGATTSTPDITHDKGVFEGGAHAR